MNARLRLTVMSCLALGWALPATQVGASAHTSAPLWHGLAQPAHTRAQELLAQADAQMRDARQKLPSDWRSVCSRTLVPDVGLESLALLEARARALRDIVRQAYARQAQLENAEVRLRRAAALAPDDAEILYALGRLLMAWEQPMPVWRCGVLRHDDEALAVLNELVREHPAFMADTVAFDRALVLTRLRRFPEAATAYENAIALGLDGGATPIILANMAEVTMLSGDLETAVTHFEHALREASGGRDYLLTMWGLAVALDRLGEHDSALTHVKKAIAAEGGAMRVLRSDGVFFEPDYERFYYEALGHEVMAHENPANRVRELGQAAAGFAAFIAASGDKGAFTQSARARLTHIEALLQAAPRAADAAR